MLNPVTAPSTRAQLADTEEAILAFAVRLCAAYIDHSRQADRPAIVAQRDLFNDLTGLVA